MPELPFYIARISLHPWEEPPISGTHGSGTVFFTGCRLHCVFCQNYQISQERQGQALSAEELLDYFFRLEEAGAHNINLVNPSHYSKRLAPLLKKAKERGLAIPIVWNSSAYEKPEDLRLLDSLIDIYLPDFKYYSNRLARRFSKVEHYRETAQAALEEMLRQVGPPVFSKGLLKKGMIVRHLQLPGQFFDSKKVLRYLHEQYADQIIISVMSQYQPMYRAKDYPGLNRRLLPIEYEKLLAYAEELGITEAYTQELETKEAESGHTPDFSQDWLHSEKIIMES